MKNCFSTSWLIAGLAALTFSLEPSAFAQTSSPTLFAATNIPSIVGAGVVTNGWTNQIIPLTKNCCVAVEALWCVTNGTATCALGGSFSIDGTNFGVAPFTLLGIVPSNNLVAVLGGSNSPAVIPGLYTNWSQAWLSGYSALMLNVFTNNSATSSVFNAGVKISRPTLNTQTY